MHSLFSSAEPVPIFTELYLRRQANGATREHQSTFNRLANIDTERASDAAKRTTDVDHLA